MNGLTVPTNRNMTKDEIELQAATGPHDEAAEEAATPVAEDTAWVQQPRFMAVDAGPERCPRCLGAGTLECTQGITMTTIKCRHCDGTGLER